jgi:hypothetical protein
VLDALRRRAFSFLSLSPYFPLIALADLDLPLQPQAADFTCGGTNLIDVYQAK